MPISDALTDRVRIRRLSTPRDLRQQLAEDVREGLRAVPMQLPPTYFYDGAGSALFEQITQLPEYYLTRAETAILADHADSLVGPGHAELVELGSGSSRKTRLLLEAMARCHDRVRYIPLDVSEGALRAAADALASDYAWLEVEGLIGDFHADLSGLPPASGRVVAFLGSTIGNLDRTERARFLTRMTGLLTPVDRLLLGVDLVKDPQSLVAAYDDAAGVTAAFNRNVLHVINRHLDADFAVDRFRHEARWNARHERIEMWLVATAEMTVTMPVAGLRASFRPGQGIRTELSCKFRPDGLHRELAAAGLETERFVTDDAGRFGLTLARPARGHSGAGSDRAP